MSVHAHVSVSVSCGCVFMCARMWAESIEVDTERLFFFFESESQKKLNLINSARLAGQRVPGILLPQPPQWWDCRIALLSPALYTGSRESNSPPYSCTASALPAEPSALP